VPQKDQINTGKRTSSGFRYGWNTGRGLNELQEEPEPERLQLEPQTLKKCTNCPSFRGGVGKKSDSEATTD